MDKFQIQNYIDFVKFLVYRPKRELDRSKLGVNCFFNTPTDPMEKQGRALAELGITHVRILCYWDDSIQPTSDYTKIDFGLLDNICKVLTHNRIKALMVIGGAPKWVRSLRDPRSQFVRFVGAVAKHFKDQDCIETYQIGNEPNTMMFSDNGVYGFDEPCMYVETLERCKKEIRGISPTKRITNAACTSIIQGYPDTTEYIKETLECGLLDHVDVYSFHYYGDGFWNLLRSDGALSVLRTISKKRDLIITEIGCLGPKKHLSYLQERLPYMTERLGGSIKYAYWYIYSDGLTPYSLSETDSSLREFLEKS